MMKSKKVELLAPAGNWVSLKIVVAAGADSVFFGIEGLNMRHSADNFTIDEISEIMAFLHERGKKGFLVLNTIVMNEDLVLAFKILDEAKKSSVDAVILWDMAVLSYAKKLGLPIHLSTQASVANIQALEAYAELGVERVVLARECTLADIKEMIRIKDEKKIDCEVETFIHGAMCLSISGRCFMSQYHHEKSANKGQCTQNCRREYVISEVRSGRELVVGQDYVLSPKDLCTIEFIDEIIDVGVDTLKIEGRMRSPEYGKIVTTSYREAIDRYYDGTLTDTRKKELKEELKKVFNRGFSSGFYFGQPDEEVSRGMEHLYEKVYVGEVLNYYNKIGVAEIEVKAATVSVNDEVLFIGKDTDLEIFTLSEIESDHKKLEQASKGMSVGIKVPYRVRPSDKFFLWQEK